MERFNDDVLLRIMKYLNLNVRTKFRLINKRCRDLLDSMQINKLVVFERLPPVPGRLEYIDEEYDLPDTAQVYDLTKFFQNATLLKQMRSLEKLVIRGVHEKVISLKTEFELATAFEQLNYLALHHVLVSSSVVLRSPKIQHLILDGCALRSKDAIGARIEELKSTQHPSDDSLSVAMYGLTDLESRMIRNLKITLETEYCLYLYLKRSELLESIEELNVVISDFNTFEFIIDNFASLRRLNCLVGTEKSAFLEQVEEVHLERLASRIRDDLAVFICGIPFHKSNASLVIEFLKTAGDMVKIEDGRLEFTGFSGTYDMLAKFERWTDLAQFYLKIDRFKVHDTRSMKQQLFARFNNCQVLDLALHHDPEPHFVQFFQLFPTIRAIRINCFNWMVKITDDLLDQIPLHCPALEQLGFDNWNSKLNFDFLFKLKRLRILEGYLYLPIHQSTFLRLIKELKYLEHIDLCFVRSVDTYRPDLTMERLSEFRRSVNEYVTEKLMVTDFFMKVQNYFKEKSNKKFVRYLYKRGKSMLQHQENEEPEFGQRKDAMFMLIDYRQEMDEVMSSRRRMNRF